MAVVVRRKLTMVSSRPEDPAGRTHLLSPTDLMMRNYNVRTIVYYDDMDGVMEQLKESLSDALTHFPPVTGRLRKAEADEKTWQVKCNDAGVRMVEAEVKDMTVAEWLEKVGGRKEEEELRLGYWEDMPEDPTYWSPYYIQLTQFQGGGMSIAVNCTHMEADLTSTSILLNAWSDIHRKSNIEIPPTFDINSIMHIHKTTTPSIDLYQSKSSWLPPAMETRFSTISIQFSNSMVEKCMSEVSGSPHGFKDPTPFEALTGLFWHAFARAASQPSITQDITVGIDLRALSTTPYNVPKGFMGNAMYFSRVHASMEDLDHHSSGGFPRIAQIIHDSTHNSREQPLQQPSRMYGPELTFLNLECVEVHKAEFVKGKKPVHVSCYITPTEREGLVLILPTPEEGFARTVMATLPHEILAKVVNDAEVLKFSPKILFGSKPE